MTGKHGNDPIYPVHDQFCQTLAKMGIAIADFKCADEVRKIRNATDHCTPLLKGNIQANLIGFTAGYMRRKTEMEYDAAFLNIIEAVSENTKNLTFQTIVAPSHRGRTTPPTVIRLLLHGYYGSP